MFEKKAIAIFINIGRRIWSYWLTFISYKYNIFRRWGKLSSALQAAGRTGFNEDKNSFYPTPLTELNANDALK